MVMIQNWLKFYRAPQNVCKLTLSNLTKFKSQICYAILPSDENIIHHLIKLHKILKHDKHFRLSVHRFWYFTSHSWKYFALLYKISPSDDFETKLVKIL